MRALRSGLNSLSCVGAGQHVIRSPNPRSGANRAWHPDGIVRSITVVMALPTLPHAFCRHCAFEPPGHADGRLPARATSKALCVKWKRRCPQGKCNNTVLHGEGDMNCT